MFIGHFGLGMAAKKIDSRPSLGTLFMASQFIDLIWPIFLLFGMERVEIEIGNTAFTPLNFSHYPLSHSLLAVFLWAILFAAVYFLFKKNAKNSLLLAMLVVSHWLLDLISHRPDLPLLPWSKVKVGLGLWNSIPLTIFVELSIFIAGILIYLYVTKSMNKAGRWGLWSLLGFLSVIYVLNLLGPVPPSVKPIAYTGLAQWLFIFWGYWIDRNRVVKNLSQ